MTINGGKSNLYTLLATCFTIKSLEYYYFYPAFSQITKYWGHKELSFQCIASAQQAKIYMLCIANFYVFICISFSKTDCLIFLFNILLSFLRTHEPKLNVWNQLCNINKNGCFPFVTNNTYTTNFIQYTKSNLLIQSIIPMILCIRNNNKIPNTFQLEVKTVIEIFTSNQKVHLNASILLVNNILAFSIIFLNYTKWKSSICYYFLAKITYSCGQNQISQQFLKMYYNDKNMGLLLTKFVNFQRKNKKPNHICFVNQK